jgi:DNA-binding response OmpR family regulator
VQTILLVDDDPIVHWVLQQYLGKAGYEISTANNGRVALEMVRDTRPDLIILDVRMSEIDGLDTLKALKKEEATKSIPVMMMTVSADEFTKMESEMYGAAVFMTKPFSPALLLSEVRRLLPTVGEERGSVGA